MRTIFEQAGGSYTQVGDYQIPDLILPENEEAFVIGIWGKRHLSYIQQHQKVRYSHLHTTGRLNAYLHEVDERAETIFFRIVNEMALREGITEELKAQNQLLWVQRMNNIRDRTKEFFNIRVNFNVSCTMSLGTMQNLFSYFTLKSTGHFGVLASEMY